MCLSNIFSQITKLLFFIYLLIFWNLYASYENRSFSGRTEVLPFFPRVSFFFNSILATISHLHFAFLFFGLYSFFFNLRSSSRRRRMWWTHSYHFASFDNLLFYRRFTNEMYIFLLIFVVTISNIKS